MRKILGVVLCCACGGDPRTPFVGSYKGTATWIYVESGRENPGTVDVTITAPESSDRLLFSGSCGFTAKVIDPDTFQTDPVSCPPQRGTSVSGVKATYTDNYDLGVGNMASKTITIFQSGTQVASDFEDKRPNDSLPFKMNVVLTKQ